MALQHPGPLSGVNPRSGGNYVCVTSPVEFGLKQAKKKGHRASPGPTPAFLALCMDYRGALQNWEERRKEREEEGGKEIITQRGRGRPVAARRRGLRGLHSPRVLRGRGVPRPQLAAVCLSRPPAPVSLGVAHFPPKDLVSHPAPQSRDGAGDGPMAEAEVDATPCCPPSTPSLPRRPLLDGGAPPHTRRVPTASCGRGGALTTHAWTGAAPAPAGASPSLPSRAFRLALSSACGMPTAKVTCGATGRNRQMPPAWPSHCVNNGFAGSSPQVGEPQAHTELSLDL